MYIGYGMSDFVAVVFWVVGKISNKFFAIIIIRFTSIVFISRITAISKRCAKADDRLIACSSSITAVYGSVTSIHRCIFIVRDVHRRNHCRKHKSTR
jgi:hypothetical protein